MKITKKVDNCFLFFFSGAHHLDLRPSTPEDPKWLVDQREAEIRLIQGWIETYRLEKEAEVSVLKRSW